MITVPLADLHAQYLSIRDEIDDAIASVIRRSAFIRGPFVEEFEISFARAMGAAHCVSCANGTDALYIAMAVLGLCPGDEVVTSAHCWISTSAMITRAGGRVVFCDTDENTYTIDPASIEAAITRRTVGIIPVHLFGQPADMDSIMTIAKKRGLWVIEDCAQAHLARYRNRQVGNFGIAATYSFYPGKNLGAMGDGGAIVTSDPSLADAMARFARHGGLTKHDHQIEGINSRLDGLQAAILSAKLRQLERWTRARQAVARIYDAALSEFENVVVPLSAVGRTHVYHHYVIQHPCRDALAVHLQANGVQTAVNYPVALPFLSAYKRFGLRPEQFPNAFRNQGRILSLPMFAEITPEQQRTVINCIETFSSPI